MLCMAVLACELQTLLVQSMPCMLSLQQLGSDRVQHPDQHNPKVKSAKSKQEAHVYMSFRSPTELAGFDFF